VVGLIAPQLGVEVALGLEGFQVRGAGVGHLYPQTPPPQARSSALRDPGPPG
jgi:hypothetical protein